MKESRDASAEANVRSSFAGAAMLRRLRIAAPIVVALITLAFFWPTVRYQFVAWDDPVEILNNPHIESFSPANVRWMFTDFERVRRYQPLDWVSWGINYQLGDRKPFGYHLGNVLQHAGCAVLLYFFLLKLLQSWRANRRAGVGEKHRMTDEVLMVCCALGSLAWALHPLRAESVAWATGRIYTQCALFLLACLLCYVHAADGAAPRRRRRVLYVLSVVLFICSLLSYAVVVGAAAALLLMDVYPLGRFPAGRPRRWIDRNALGIYLEKVPYLLAALAVGLVTLWARWNASGMWAPPPTLQQFSLFARIMQAFYTLAYYAWIPFRPVHLLPVYTRLMGFDPTDGIFLLSAAAVIGISVMAWALRRRLPWLAAAWGFHLLMLAPFLGLTEYPHYTNDRYAHIQEFAMAALLAGLLAYALARFGIAVFRGAVACSTVLVLALGVLCYLHGAMWADTEQFFQTTIAELGDDPYRMDIYYRLGEYYVQAGRPADAVAAGDAVFQMAVAAGERGESAHKIGAIFYEAARTYDLLGGTNETSRTLVLAGLAYDRAGLFERAIQRFKRAAALSPRDAQIHLDLGAVLFMTGKSAEAAGELDAALAVDPKLRPEREKILARWTARRAQIAPAIPGG